MDHTGIPGPLGSGDKGGAKVGWLAFMDRAILMDLAHEEKKISFSHCIF
jgi:hypothetical protein